MKPNMISTVLLCVATACASAPPPSAPPPVEPAPAPPPPPAAPPEEPKAAAEPTAEEKARAEALKRLEADRAHMEAEHKAELARWNEELHAEAKKLAEKKYWSTHVGLKAAMAGKHRIPGNADRDQYRHPLKTLTFFGLKPTDTVLEYGPGGGWYTELLAPFLATRGKLLVTSTDPNGPKEERSTYYGERLKLFLDRSPELFGKVERTMIDTKAPKLDTEGTTDLVLAIRTLHGMHNSGTLDAWLAEFHQALKPKGVLGIVQHRAKPEANPDESAKKGYLPEAWVIEKVEAAGFKLEKKSEINANPKDTKDYPEGVWTLPPTLRLKDQDREKYVAIGESDRMTLKFVKVAKPKPAAEKAKSDGKPATPAKAGAAQPSAGKPSAAKAAPAKAAPAKAASSTAKAAAPAAPPAKAAKP